MSRPSGRKPWNPLQARVLERTKLLGTRPAVSASILTQWFKYEERALNERDLRALGTFCDIPYEQALEEAGGKTASDRWSDLGKANVANLPKPHTKEHIANARKGGDATRSRFRDGTLVIDEDRLAKIKESKAANPNGLSKSLANLDKRTQRGIAQSILGGLISRGMSREEAERAAISKLMAPPDSIGDERAALSLLRPRRRNKGGRPRAEGKRDFIRMTLEQQGARNWTEIARLVMVRFEGISEPSDVELARRSKNLTAWYYRRPPTV